MLPQQPASAQHLGRYTSEQSLSLVVKPQDPFLLVSERLAKSDDYRPFTQLAAVTLTGLRARGRAETGRHRGHTQLLDYCRSRGGSTTPVISSLVTVFAEFIGEVHCVNSPVTAASASAVGSVQDILVSLVCDRVLHRVAGP
jgi:hypothetical protein